MRLIVDLTYSGSPIKPSGDQRVVTLAEIAGALRQPRQLYVLLRDPDVDEVQVMCDDRPLNGVQSGALLLAALSGANRIQVSSPGRTVVAGSAATRRRAVSTLAVALPAELARSARWYRQARRIAATSFSLPSCRRGEVRRVSYLRSEPSLRWLGSQVGGAAAHTAGVINGLSSADVEVTVFAPEQPDGLRAAAVEVIEPRHIVQLAHWLTLIDYSRVIVDAAARVPSDLVYHRYALGSYAGLELARRLDVPLVLEFNGSEIWAMQHWGSGRLPLLGGLAALERRNLTDASLIVVVSHPLQDQLVEQGINPDRILVNPNGVDLEMLADARSGSPSEWRARLELPEAPTVGFVGTFGLWHGVKLLPELIERVAALAPQARWVLIGGGPLHSEVAGEIGRRGFADRVALTGIVPRTRAPELLAACDVCVSPHVPNPDGTPFFGSPTKLFEYMGLGRAIVASDLDQIGEVIDDGRTGLLTPPGNVLAAARAVARLLDDEDLRGRLGAAALREAEERYSWDAHVGRILEALGALDSNGFRLHASGYAALGTQQTQ